MSELQDELEQVGEELQRYLAECQVGEVGVVKLTPLRELAERLDLQRWIQKGGLRGAALKDFVRTYLQHTNRLHHPKYLGHQVAVPHTNASLGALVDSFTNNTTSIYEMGPAVNTVEMVLINWMLEKVGWAAAPLPPIDDEGKNDSSTSIGGGVLTSGGSLANLTALVAARSQIAPETWDTGNPSDLAILAPADCHYSIERAAGIMGLGRKSIFPIELGTRGDLKGRIDPEKLETSLARAKFEGKRVMAVVANACSTAAGLYDPLEEVGRFCRERGLWFHVDGAHGASLLLSEKYRHRLKGVELADSMIWDAHKLMRTPALCAAVLVRKRKTLDQAFQQEGSYIFHEKVQPGFDALHRSVECTKTGAALRLFTALAAEGEQGMARSIEYLHELAEQAYVFCQKSDLFESPVRPESNILCFRVPGDDRRQIQLRDQLIADGVCYLTTTMYNGKRYLRFVLMNPKTRLDDVEEVLQAIEEKCRRSDG